MCFLEQKTRKFFSLFDKTSIRSKIKSRVHLGARTCLSAHPHKNSSTIEPKHIIAVGIQGNGLLTPKQFPHLDTMHSVHLGSRKENWVRDFAQRRGPSSPPTHSFTMLERDARQTPPQGPAGRSTKSF